MSNITEPKGISDQEIERIATLAFSEAHKAAVLAKLPVIAIRDKSLVKIFHDGREEVIKELDGGRIAWHGDKIIDIKENRK